jgi:hypothetical protein
MIASVHIADVGVRSALGALRKTPNPAATTGLRYATVALAAPLSGSFRPSPDPRRVGLVAFWDDDRALDQFLADHPIAGKLASGWQVRLEPMRAWGTWPGLPDELPRSRTIDHDGPAVVLTLGRLRLTQAVRFLRTSARAEARVVEAPGLIWATGLGRPPFVGTCSLWKATQALTTYAYGQSDAAHPSAISADRAKPFHHQSAFIRFRPYGSTGSLDGQNRLVGTWLSAV